MEHSFPPQMFVKRGILSGWSAHEELTEAVEAKPTLVAEYQLVTVRLAHREVTVDDFEDYQTPDDRPPF